MKRGTVAVVGRPNVGKSTLVNAMAGAKVSIVSRRRQTTRGIVQTMCETNDAKIILLDSPGWQTRGGDFARAINGGARRAAEFADALVFITTPRWTEEDAEFLSRLPPQTPAAAVVNKIDLVRDKKTLLPFADSLRQKRDFAAVVPTSAQRGTGIRTLLAEIAEMLPDSDSESDSDSNSNSNSDSEKEFGKGCGKEFSAAVLESDSAEGGEERNFLCGELLREKLFRALGGELPYRIGVLANVLQRQNGVWFVRADIYAERDSQKAIILGRGGAMLQKLAAAARRDMEKLCGGKVFLETRVRVRAEWRRDSRLLAKMRIGAAHSQTAR